MPEVNGFDVVEALDQQVDTAAIPIVVVTVARVSALDRARLSPSVTSIVSKTTTDRDHFVSEVRRAMAGRQTA